MESAGYVVSEFGSAEEFLESAGDTESDCLILDMRLPGMDGLELQTRLAGLGRRLPIVFVTAHGSEEMRQQAMRRGASGFLLKPFRREGLLASVRTALAASPGGPE